MQAAQQHMAQQPVRSHRAADAVPLLGTSGHMPHHLPIHASSAPGSATALAAAGPDDMQASGAQADADGHTQFGGSMRTSSGGVRSHGPGV